MANVVYDLTEAFIASTGKFPYYGILRVVEEIAVELYQLDPDLRFVMFSYADDAFFEIHPSQSNGRINLNIPQGVKQFHHLRRRHYNKNYIRDALLPLVHRGIRHINSKSWKRARLDLTELDMNGKLLVSVGRPKHMVAALDALERTGARYDFIPLLHDMFPLHGFTPEDRNRFNLNFIGDNCQVIKRASRIIAISEFTKSDTQGFSRDGLLPALPEIVTVPLVQECREGNEPPVQHIPDDPYILAVGATLGRKNIEVVFNALLLLKEKNAFVPRFVLAGAPRKRVQEYLQQDRYDSVRSNVDFIPNPNQTDLVRLYKSAMALVLPSRIEGWGLPAGEALWTGTPAVCSNIPVLYEVCGELGLYFDPNRPDELAQIIERLHQDTEFSDGLRARIAREAARLRTWKDVARDIKKVYDSDISEKVTI